VPEGREGNRGRESEGKKRLTWGKEDFFLMPCRRDLCHVGEKLDLSWILVVSISNLPSFKTIESHRPLLLRKLRPMFIASPKEWWRAGRSLIVKIRNLDLYLPNEQNYKQPFRQFSF
jgi:hypothetical protein